MENISQRGFGNRLQQHLEVLMRRWLLRLTIKISALLRLTVNPNDTM